MPCKYLQKTNNVNGECFADKITCCALTFVDKEKPKWKPLHERLIDEVLNGKAEEYTDIKET